MIVKGFYISIILVIFVGICSGQGMPENVVTQEDVERQHPQVPSFDTTPPRLVKTGPGRFKVGKVILDKNKGMIRLKGEINMADGLVEYIACTVYGKLHESVIAVDADPYHIQIALLLLGLAPGDRPIKFQGAQENPCGDPVKIVISWQKNKRRVDCSPEQILIHIKTKEIMEKTDWVFTGSQIVNGRFMAQQEGSIIASYHDPIAIIDHRSRTGADDTLYYANKALLPPKGTPVELKIFAVLNETIKKRTLCRPETDFHGEKK